MQKRVTRPPVTPRDPRFIVGLSMVLLAVAVCLFTMFHTPKPHSLSTEEVFAEGKETKDFMQVSLYTITTYRAGKATGGGHVRYTKGGQLYGYGSGPNGMALTLVFNAETEGFKKCEPFFMLALPFKKELFIAGTGYAGTNGIRNPATGQVGSNSVITFTKVTHCDYTDLTNGY